MQESTNISFKKAVYAAKFVIRSRTGVAILKNSYQQKSDPVADKFVNLLQGINIKEMRKLERERSKFVNDQSEKLNLDKVSESVTPRKSQSSRRTVSQELKDFANEKKRTERLRVIEEDTSHKMKYSTEAVLYRRELIPLFEKHSKLAWEGNDIENDEITKENSQLKLTRTKLVRHNLNSYSEDKRLELWLNQVEIANLDRKEKSAERKSKKQKHCEKENEVFSSQQTSFLPKCDDVKLSSQKLELPKLEQTNSCTSENSLKLPKLEPSVSPESRRVESTEERSLKDPRFTRLMESLAPSKNNLKLPKIVAKPNSRAS